ncbi:MAG: hypothetical protein ACM3TR_08985 [Caulobacteraceae bacterium]
MQNTARTKVYMLLIIFTAAYLRFRFVLYTPFEFKIDAWSMYNYALNVAKGEYYGHSFGEHWARYAYWPPLYIFLSGFVYKFWGTAKDFIAMRMIQAAFSTVSCLIAYLTAAEAIKRYSPYYREAGFIAGIIMAVNPRMVVYTNHLYVESVFMTIYLLVVYFGLKYIKYELPLKLTHHNGYIPHKYLILYSLTLGVGNLTRPVLLLLPGVMLVFILLFSTAKRYNFRRTIEIIVLDGAITLVIMLLTFTPWIIRNYAVTGRFILIDANGPINFYMAHNELANGQWVDVKPYTDINRLYETGYKEGLKFIINNPKREAQLMKIKERLFLYDGDFHITEAKAYLDRTYRLPLYGSLRRMGIVGSNFSNRYYRIPMISFTFLWEAGLILFALFTIKLLLAGALRVLFSESAWIIGNVLYVNLIILIFYFAPRYRSIVEPFLCIAVGILLAGIAAPLPGIVSVSDD